MKRSTKKTWKKTGGGTFRMKDGTIIKPNQIFQAVEKEIPLAFRDVIIEVSDAEEEVLHLKGPFEIVERTTKGWFDVMDATGQPANAEAIRKAEAEDLKEAMEEEFGTGDDKDDDE